MAATPIHLSSTPERQARSTGSPSVEQSSWLESEAARSDDADPVASAIARGDAKEALYLLTPAYSEQIYQYCLAMLGDPTLADDVAQRVFLEAYRDIKDLRVHSRSSIRSWLFGIARHRALDAAKARKMENERLVAYKAAETIDSAPPPDELLEAARTNVRKSEALEKCLARLAPPIREVLLLRFRDGLTYEEMAEICGEKPNTLRIRLVRALGVLRRCLEHQLKDNP